APWDINVGASLTARQGYAAALREAVTGLNTGTINVVLDPIGSIRFKNVYELDMRLAKDFRIANRLGVTLSGDLFNAPNKRNILQRETLILQNANGGATDRARPAGASPRFRRRACGVWARSSTSKAPLPQRKMPAGSPAGIFFFAFPKRFDKLRLTFGSPFPGEMIQQSERMGTTD